jgi:preprotein translocase subunit SecD
VAPPTVRFRPGRYLAVFAALVVVLYGLVFLTGDRSPTPELGIDLQGGTQVTLTARTETGVAPTPDQLNLARQIIEQRVNGLGVSGAQVVQNGNNLVITVPGQEGSQARSLGQTARLYFRPVEQGPLAAGPAPGQAQPGQAQPGQAQPGQTQPGQGQTQPGPSPSGGGGGTPGRAPAGQSVRLPSPALPGQTPTPPAPPGGGGSAPAGGNGTSGQDPRQTAAIEQAKQLRQSSDPTIQALALQSLNCQAEDPLRGYDDPTKPLVACDRNGQAKYVLGPSILPGTEVSGATAAPNQQGVGYAINVTFTSVGGGIWGQYTSANIGKAVAFTLDSQVVSAPVIQGAQPGGNSQITGNFDQQSSTDLANVLKYGSLPLSFDTSDAQTISATLGLASLEAGLIAGVIGLALVFVYSLFYYRALGVLTILSLVLSGLIVYAVLVLLGRSIGFTLDLSGVAGFIVAIGITADSFVIFFERIKDEVRDGRSFRSAVPRGWVRARRTILSGDAVSFLAAVVLYALAVGQVRGFAFTLGMSTVLDLVVVFLVTHPLLALASNSRLFESPAWSGLGRVASGRTRRPGDGPDDGVSGPRPGARPTTTRRPTPSGARSPRSGSGRGGTR